MTAYSDAKTQSFSQTYDALSRPLVRTEPDATTTWTWGNTATSFNIGELAAVSEASAGGTYSEGYSYYSGWMQQITVRSAMRSPGAPSLRHEIERLFWKQIATGITSEKAAEAVGVSQPIGTRWFRRRGGMPLFMSLSISGRYLSFAEREEIGLLSVQGVSAREIARRIGRNASTVSRELTRNAATRGGRLEYRALVAQWKAELIAKRPKPAKLVTNIRLHRYVQDRLEGQVRDANGNTTGARMSARALWQWAHTDSA